MHLNIQQRREQVIAYALTFDVQGMVQENFRPKRNEEGQVLLHQQKQLKPIESCCINVCNVYNGLDTGPYKMR
jgi:hypothetical protein